MIRRVTCSPHCGVVGTSSGRDEANPGGIVVSSLISEEGVVKGLAELLGHGDVAGEEVRIDAAFVQYDEHSVNF